MTWRRASIETTAPGTRARTSRATVSCLPRLTDGVLRRAGSQLPARGPDLASLAPTDGDGGCARGEPLDEASHRFLVGPLPGHARDGVVGNEVDLGRQRARPGRQPECVLARVVDAGEQRVFERDAAARQLGVLARRFDDLLD